MSVWTHVGDVRPLSSFKKAKKGLAMRLYSLYDRKAREYGQQIIGGRNDELVMRSLLELRGSDAMPGKYPEDFELYCLGEFDQRAGQITPIIPPEFVIGLQTLFSAVAREVVREER